MQMIFVQIDSIICHPIIFIWHSNIELSKCVRYCAIQHGTCVIDPAKGLATMWTKKTKSRSHSVQKKTTQQMQQRHPCKNIHIYIYKAFSVPSLNKKKQFPSPTHFWVDDCPFPKVWHVIVPWRINCSKFKPSCWQKDLRIAARQNLQRLWQFPCEVQKISVAWRNVKNRNLLNMQIYPSHGMYFSSNIKKTDTTIFWFKGVFKDLVKSYLCQT